MDKWTESEDELIRSMAAQGQSASVIAQRLSGRSRESVIGRSRRIGVRLNGRPGGSKPRGPKPEAESTPLPGGAARYTAKHLNPGSPAPAPAGPTVGPAPWSDHEVERLRGMANNGYSGSQIANRLGRTREAVAAKCDRLDISLKGHGQQTTSTVPIAVAPTLKALMAQPLPKVDDGKGCRFIEGDAYCGAPKHGRWSYCRACWPKVYRSQTPPPLKAMNRVAKPFSLGFAG